MDKYRDMFISKNSELKTQFVFYEVFIAIVLSTIGLFMVDSERFYIVIIAGIIYIIDLLLNNIFLQQTLRNNTYYATIVDDDPEACTKGMANTLKYNKENYLHQYRNHRRLSRITLLVVIIAKNLDDFYSNTIRNIETQIERENKTTS